MFQQWKPPFGYFVRINILWNNISGAKAEENLLLTTWAELNRFPIEAIFSLPFDSFKTNLNTTRKYYAAMIFIQTEFEFLLSWTKFAEFITLVKWNYFQCVELKCSCIICSEREFIHFDLKVRGIVDEILDEIKLKKQFFHHEIFSRKIFSQNMKSNETVEAQKYLLLSLPSIFFHRNLFA